MMELGVEPPQGPPDDLSRQASLPAAGGAVQATRAASAGWKPAATTWPGVACL
jgi:hypothetical protein